MYIRLYKFLDKFKCVYKKQFGFRNFRPSTDVYFAIFNSILTYGIQVWGQNKN